MRSSRPAVHLVEAPLAAPAPAQQGENAHPPRGVRMKDPPGAPGTTGGLGLRLVQAFFAAAALAVMASTNDFPSVSAFCYLVAAAILQCLWSLSLAIVDIYALLVKRSLRNSTIVCIFTIGDGNKAIEKRAASGPSGDSQPRKQQQRLPSQVMLLGLWASRAHLCRT